MKCDYCGRKLPKGRKRFCSDKHKDKWHNWNNPRGKFAHLDTSDRDPREDYPEGWDEHKFS